MQSFDDFLKTLSTQDMEEITKLTITQIKSSGTDWSEREIKLAMLISQTSSIGYKEMLRRYHNWLQAQMQN